MTATEGRPDVRWGHDTLRLEIGADPDGRSRLHRLAVPGRPCPEPRPGSPLPLVEISTTDHGFHWSSHRAIDTDIGARLRYREHQVARDGVWHELTVRLHDPETGLAADVVYRSPDGVAALRGQVVLRNEGARPMALESVTSLVVGGLTEDDTQLDAADLLWAENDWLAEYRWQRRAIRLTSPVLSGSVHCFNGRGGFSRAAQGTWSSGGHLPMGGLTDRRTGRTVLWRIETNGRGWHWECGERADVAYPALSGPSAERHGWSHLLEPGGTFRTVPVALTLGDDGIDDAFAALTRYRRAIRRPPPRPPAAARHLQRLHELPDG